MLDQTNLPEWQDKLCPEHLSSWSEAGNLLNMPGVEYMEDELDPEQQWQEQAANPEGLNTDGADHVPAPMQSGERPGETFEGTLGGLDLAPSQLEIIDAELRLQETLHSLYYTPGYCSPVHHVGCTHDPG
jgi:hypothetical protein